MNLKNSIFVVLASVSLAFSNPILLPERPIDFGGGLNLGVQPSAIADNESPSMSNFVNDIQGAAVKRNGFKRWNTQSISSQPINSFFRVYSSSNDQYISALLLTTKDRIYYTTSSFNQEPIFTLTNNSTYYYNDVWRWAFINNQAIGVGDSLQDDVKKFDLNTASFTNLFQQFAIGAGTTIRIRGKYPLSTRNYLLLGNCAEISTPASLTNSTTYYPTRVYYSILDFPSSFTAKKE